MTTKINGTNTVASPAITGDDVDTGVVYGNAQVDISIGGASKATVDSNGRLGIGTTSPSGLLHLSGDTCQLHFTDEDDSASSRIYQSGATFAIDVDQANAKGSSVLQFRVDDGERIRVDGSGNAGFSTTDPTNADSADGGLQIRPNHSAGSPQIAFKRASSGSTSTAIVFVNGNVGKGSITYDSSGTAYNTSSDYRLKENVTAISDGITRLKTLKPSRFNFKVDKDTTVDGFLAHEVTAVPEAIKGTKDQVATDEDTAYTKGDPIYQSIDQSKLVPLLTAALQEEVAKREALETRVAALEGA